MKIVHCKIFCRQPTKNFYGKFLLLKFFWFVHGGAISAASFCEKFLHIALKQLYVWLPFLQEYLGLKLLEKNYNMKTKVMDRP